MEIALDRYQLAVRPTDHPAMQPKQNAKNNNVDDSEQPLPTQIILQSFAYFYCIRHTQYQPHTSIRLVCMLPLYARTARWPIHCHSHADAEHARAHTFATRKTIPLQTLTFYPLKNATANVRY